MESLENRIANIENILGITNREISSEAIERFIDELLTDPETNTIMLDSLERVFYRKIIKIVMKTLEKTINSTKIEIFNHRITANISGI
jgi:hypothetical protein